MIARNLLSLVSVGLLTTVLLGGWWSARGEEEAIDLQRVRELHARVIRGAKLTPAEQADYDRGKLEWASKRAKTRRPDETSRPARPGAQTPNPAEADPLAAPGERAVEAFTVSEKICPVEAIEIKASTGEKVVGFLRKPPGDGPFPALVQLHGGLKAENSARLRTLLTQPTMSRFLAAGYLVVAPTFRDREVNPQTRDALEDCLAVIDWVKKRPDVDPKSVVVWGDSGGGSLALELAGETTLAAAAAQEPATILMIGIMTKENSAKGPLMQDPKKYWTPQLQAFTRAKIERIGCPIFIAYGDRSQINKVNHEIVIPELKAASKELETKLYPGQQHGFSKASQEFFVDAQKFFGKHLATQPTPIPSAKR